MSQDYHSLWIRSSTGHLCVELTESDLPPPYLPELKGIATDKSIMVNDVNAEARAIDALNVYEFHYACHYHLGQRRSLSLSAEGEVNPGAVIYHPSGSRPEDSVEIATQTTMNAGISDWTSLSRDAGRAVMENGWTR